MNYDTNLRHHDQTSRLYQAGIPSSYYQYLYNSDTKDLRCLSGFIPVPGDCTLRRDRVRYFLSVIGNELISICGEWYHVITTLPAVPSGIIAIEGGAMILFSGGIEPMYITYNEDIHRWVVSEQPHHFPAPFAIERSDMATLSSALPAVSLKGEYDSRSTRLSAADAMTLGKAFGEAHCALADTAMARRLYIHPVMARYRIRDKQGAVIYQSAPVLITPSTPLQATEAVITLTGDKFNRTAETDLVAHAFNLKLTTLYDMANLDGWNGVIGSVDILVSLPLNLYQPSVAPIHRFGNFTATSGSIVVRLPGVTDSPQPAAEGSRFHAMVTGLLDRIDSALSPDNADRHDAATELAALCKMLDIKLPEPDQYSRLMTSLSAPHSFSASHASRSGNTIVWGDISAIPFNGYSPAEVGVTTRDLSAPLPVASSISFADGVSTVVNSSTLTSAAPQSISPLVVYPAPDAREVTMIVGTGKVCLPLCPSPGGRWSYYLSPSATPVALADTLPSFVLPAANPPVRRFPDLVACSGATPPFRLSALTRCSGDVTCVTPTALPVSSWDFARANFYAFTSAGSCAVTVNSKRDSITAARLDSRGVDHRHAVAVTPEGVMAIACGDLLRMNSNRVTTLLTGVTADRVGWSQPCGDGFDIPSAPCGELWCVDGSGDTPSGKILIVSPDGKRCYFRDGLCVSELIQGEQGVLLAPAPGGGMLNLSREVSAPSTVSHDFRFPASSLRAVASQRFCRLTIPVYGFGLVGDIDVRIDDGLGVEHSRSLVRLAVNGDLNSPLTVMIPLPMRSLRRKSASVFPALTVLYRLSGSSIVIDPPTLNP